MIHVLISEPFESQISATVLEQAAAAVLQHEQVKPGSDLSIAIEDDERLRELNLQFLDIDAPTDVLSFPSGGEEIDPETQNDYLGDIIISYQRAQEQASGAGHEVTDEMQLLVVHGVLHLLGYDHADPDEKARMWSAQDEILTSLGVHIKKLPE